MIGLPTALISPLLTFGCTAISRLLKSCFKKSVTALRPRYTSPCLTALLKCFNKQDMVVRAVYKMKDKARQCVAFGGLPFEGRNL